jgi:acetolactate synthase-1/2/3 large subunit
MGWGLPAAIGAATAIDAEIFCLTGDGGLMMNLQELATVKKINHPIKIFIYNNRGYLTMQQSQKLAFGEVVGADTKSGLYFPNWELIAKSFDLDYIYLHNDNDITDEKLESIIESKQSIIIELNMSIDQEQIPRAIPFRNEKFSQSLLENPYPFVSDLILEKSLAYLKGDKNGRN